MLELPQITRRGITVGMLAAFKISAPKNLHVMRINVKPARVNFKLTDAATLGILAFLDAGTLFPSNGTLKWSMPIAASDHNSYANFRSKHIQGSCQKTRVLPSHHRLRRGDI